MGRKTFKTNIRVEAIPIAQWWQPGIEMPEQHEVRMCEELANSIRRHCDTHNVLVVWDTGRVCEFCGATWTEDGVNFNGGCCDEDAVADPDADNSATLVE